MASSRRNGGPGGLTDPTPQGRSKLRAERAQRRSFGDWAGAYGSGGGAQSAGLEEVGLGAQQPGGVLRWTPEKEPEGGGS